MNKLIPFLFLCLISSAFAQQNSDSEAAVEVNPDGVTVKRQDSTLIEEYREGGRLEMIKITPESGPAYFIEDRAGDGTMSPRESDMDSEFNIRTWKIGEW